MNSKKSHQVVKTVIRRLLDPQLCRPQDPEDRPLCCGKTTLLTIRCHGRPVVEISGCLLFGELAEPWVCGSSQGLPVSLAGLLLAPGQPCCPVEVSEQAQELVLADHSLLPTSATRQPFVPQVDTGTFPHSSSVATLRREHYYYCCFYMRINVWLPRCSVLLEKVKVVCVISVSQSPFHVAPSFPRLP